MKQGVILIVLSTLLAAGCVSMRPNTPWTKEETVRWYAEGRKSVRYVGYQGSDSTQHHFIARVMDEWTFFQISKAELKLPDERPYTSASSAPLYYYLVDPAREFEKVSPKKEPTTR